MKTQSVWLHNVECGTVTATVKTQFKVESMHSLFNTAK